MKGMVIRVRNVIFNRFNTVPGRKNRFFSEYDLWLSLTRIPFPITIINMQEKTSFRKRRQLFKRGGSVPP